MRSIFLLLFLISFTQFSFAQKKKAEQLYETGLAKYNNKDYSGAIADFTAALDLKSSYAEAYYYRGLAKSYLGDNNAAVQDFAQAIKNKHNYQEAYFESGYTKNLLYDYAGAIADYTEVIKLKPDYRDAFYNRGLAKYYLKDYTGSILDNSKAIELDPSYQNAYYNRSLCRYEMKDYNGTIADSKKVIELNPEYADAYYNMGLSLYNLEQYTASINAYTKVIELKPEFMNAYYNRGLSRYYSKDYSGAERDFTKVLATNTKDEEAYYRRGLAKYHLKDIPGSVSDYEKAIALKPDYEAAKKELAFTSTELTELKRNSGSSVEAENINIDVNIKLPQIWAVIVGVSHYKDPKMNLKFADKDATDFYNFLKSPQGGSLPDDHIILLTNEKATRSNIIKALNEKFNRAFEDDMVILFIASHGQPDPVGNEVYFLNHDAESDNLGGTAVSQIDIEKVFQRTRAKKRLWIADACHSGGAGLQIRADQSALTNKLLSEIANSSNGMALLTASSSSEYSYEDAKWGGGHGVFTHYLLKGMQGEADKDKNGLVDLRELYEFVYRQVSHDTNGQQHPELKGNFDNKLPISVHH